MPATSRPSDASGDLTFRDLVAALSNPDAYPNQPAQIERIETHASVVFIAGEDVYKLKKPVDFGFLDYSTPERRRQMCELEVGLNQRLAPRVYLGVLEVVRAGNAVRVGQRGEVIDYLVHMRHLPETERLETLIERESVQDSDIDAIARRIAAFHRQTDRGPDTSQWGKLDVVRHNVEENFEQTIPYVDRTIPDRTFRAITSYARGFLRDNEQLFRERVQTGMICDGHGDLRAEHVYLLDEVTIVDCIEFNDRIRCGDVAADIGFLAMDLDAQNRPDLSDRLIATYVAASGFDVAAVLDFYRCYRACVRGKVASFRLDETGADARREARRFFHIAHRYATRDRGPRLILMSGLTGSGKSTLARELADTLPAAIRDSDTTRKRLAGIDPSERQEVEYGSGIYSPAMSAKVYQALLDSARQRLVKGQTVILDATYINRSDRRAAANLAAEIGSAFYIAHCEAPEDVTRERLAQRRGEAERISDGRWEIYLAQRTAADPFTDEEAVYRIAVDTSAPLEAQVEVVLARLEA